jgi:hypothetical protein
VRRTRPALVHDGRAADNRPVTLGPRFVPAALAALAAALAGGVAWGLIAKTTDYEIGIVAWAIGFLAGTAAAYVAPAARGIPLQVSAVVAALAGILLGKYLTFAWDLQDFAEERGVHIGLFSEEMWDVFRIDYEIVFGWLDLLWAGLAVFSAARATAAPYRARDPEPPAAP